jgi:hypothetical protein
MKNTFLFLALLLSVCSCHKHKGGFNEHIFISPYEEAGSKSFTLSCRTEKTYSCSQASIFTTAVVNGRDITVALKYLELSGCSSSATPVPARATASVGALDTGTYTFTINNGGRISTGTLIVDSASFTITYAGANDVTIERTQLMRIPAHTIWGYASYSNPSMAGVANSFVDSFISFGAQLFNGAPGYYGYFTFDGTTITINSSMPYANTKTFAYHYPGDLNLVPPVVDSFGRRNTLAVFATWTYNGNYFVSPQPPL